MKLKNYKVNKKEINKYYIYIFYKIKNFGNFNKQGCLSGLRGMTKDHIFVGSNPTLCKFFAFINSYIY